MRRFADASVLALIVSLMTAVPAARAQVDDTGASGDVGASADVGIGMEAEAPPDDTGGAGGGVMLGDEQATAEDQMGVEEVRDSTDPWEDPHEGYWFAGLFYRHIFVPEFLLNLFLDESTGGSNSAFGAEVTYRKDGFDIIGSLWWAGYATEGPFQGAGDPITDMEMIDSGLSVLFLSGTFLWSTEFDDMFALEYGVAVGVGVVLGDVIRTEAYDAGGGNWRPCAGVGNPDATYCDGPSARDGEDGGHYNVTARKWSDGGSVPNVVPWLAIPQIALRIKPIHQLMIRIEGGFGLGFFLGGSMSYGF